MLMNRRASWPLRTVWIAVLAVGSAAIVYGQAAQAPEKQAATPPTPSNASQPDCPQIADTNIPLGTTIQAKVTGLINAHLKPGRKIWVNAVNGVIYPECRLENDAAIYGTVTGASSTKNPDGSELSLQFDSADCTGHSKQKMKLLLVGVLAPPDASGSLHDAVPTEVHGARQITDAVAETNGYDARLNPGGPPHTVHAGAVVGFKNLTLEPQGGPQCSAKMTSTNRNIELGPGTVLLLALRVGE
jgi:hypothetical protein